jgi:hypothetical protein
VFVCVVAGVLAVARRRLAPPRGFALLAWTALPLIAIFAIAAMRKRTTLPHWPGVAYLTLLPVAAAYLAERQRSALISKPALISALAFVALIGFGLLQIDFGILDLHTASAASVADEDGALQDGGDPSTELIGWRELQAGIERLREEDRQAGRTPAVLLLSDRWYHAAHLDFYVGSRIGLATACLADLEHARALAFMNPPELVDGVSGYYVVPSNRFRDPLEHAYGGVWLKDRFTRIEGPRTIEVERGGRVAKRFYVYRCEELHPVTPPKKSRRPKSSPP